MSRSEKPQFEWTTGKVWAIALVAIVGILCKTAIIVSSHPYVFMIEMDDNTLKAVQNTTGAANEISVRQASEVAICQFQNVTLSNDRVMAVWFVGEKCSLLANDKGYEFEGKKIIRDK